MLLAVMSIGFISAVPLAFRYGLKHAVPVLETLPVYLMFASPGIVLAAPFVLLFKDAEGLRLWWILAIGIAIGPTFMVTWILFSSHGSLRWQANGMAVVLSIVIGVLTTVFYVLLLRHFTKARLQRHASL
jgi:hypothetical protein